VQPDHSSVWSYQAPRDAEEFLYFYLDAAPIGCQLFMLGGTTSDCTAFPPFLASYATRLLAQALKRLLLVLQ
jgi:hypothetical protein